MKVEPTFRCTRNDAIALHLMHFLNQSRRLGLINLTLGRCFIQRRWWELKPESLRAVLRSVYVFGQKLNKQTLTV